MTDYIMFKKHRDEASDRFVKIQHNRVHEFIRKNKWAHEIILSKKRDHKPRVRLTLDIDWEVREHEEIYLENLKKTYKAVQDQGFYVTECSRKKKISIHAVHKEFAFLDKYRMKKYILNTLIPKWKKMGGVYKVMTRVIDTGFSTLRCIWQRKNSYDGKWPKDDVVMKRMNPIKKVVNILNYMSTYVTDKHRIIEVEMAEGEEVLYMSSYGFPCAEDVESPKFDFIKELVLEALDPSYVSTYDKWRSVAFALAYVERTKRMMDLFYTISKRTTAGNYSSTACGRLWNDACTRELPMNCITDDSLEYYCRLSDLKKYKEIKSKYIAETDETCKKMFMDPDHPYFSATFAKEYSGKYLDDLEKFHRDALKIYGFTTTGKTKYIIKEYKRNKKCRKVYSIDTSKPGFLNDLCLFKKVGEKDGKDKYDKRTFLQCIEDADDLNRFSYTGQIFDPDNDDVGAFNQWPGFRAKEIDGEIDYDLIDPFLYHIREIMCEGHAEVYRHHLDFLSQMIQQPGKKLGICPILMGNQGSGKGAYVDIIRAMLGTSLVSEQKNMGSILGKFDTLIHDKLLVFFNESKDVNSKKYKDAFDTLKTLISDKHQTKSEKYEKGIDTIHYARFIISSNNDFPALIDSSDRRFVVKRASGKHIRDKKYFSRLYSYIEDDNAINHFFTYLLRKVKFTRDRKIPLTLERMSLIESASDIKVEILEYLVKRFEGEYLPADKLLSICRTDFEKFYKSKRQMGAHLKRYFNLDGNRLKQVKINGKNTRVYHVEVDHIKKMIKKYHPLLK